MKLSQFSFNLPEEQIALYPHSVYHEIKDEKGKKQTVRVTRRDECRLMVLHRQSGTIDMFKQDKKNPVAISSDIQEACRTFEESGGAYILYSIARAKSILAKVPA